MPPQPNTVWQPDEATVARANRTAAMRDRNIATYGEFHAWSVGDRAAFWQDTLDRLGIAFRVPPEAVLGAGGKVEAPDWLPGARLNIVESCFKGDFGATAIWFAKQGRTARLTVGELRDDVMRVANGLIAAGIRPGDRVAITMPMTAEAVTAYLATVWIGAVVVSIADSFAPDEISARLRITGCTTVITQDLVRRGGKELAMYAKVVEAGAPRAIVVDTGAAMQLGADDVFWEDFLGPRDHVEPVVGDPDDITNILFSSGTTGDPKAIPWSHLTPIKVAMDGHYHQDIHSDDIVAWPTNLGWMMGPWLIFASLINGASLALYDDVPTGEDFGRFVQDVGVTVLGVVPSAVSVWRASGCMEGLDWSRIRLFSSTGEPSNPSDMAYLMGLAGNKPVIEYCGGTEIGGSYLTATVLQRALPSLFTTPALGLDVCILDGAGEHASSGELFLVPPSIGLSSDLLDGDHHNVYFAGVPSPDGVLLRRHGDHFERLEGGYYRALGRIDDTMNLGGIKVSSAEIERVVGVLPDVAEAAAVSVPSEGGGPSLLVVFAVPGGAASPDPETLRSAMQAEVRSRLNPLFKIHEVVVVGALPRTASGKVMRRSLRDRYRRGDGP